MLVPAELKYAETHEWVRVEGNIGTVGITDHAQAELTDIVYVELPQPGSSLTRKQGAAVVESVKAASDIYAPVTGRVLEVNALLEGDPGLVNKDPYGDGWLFRLELADTSELAELKDGAAYQAQISG